MKRIYKYPILVTRFPRLHMPEGYKILTIQSQNGSPCIWAEVDPKATPTEVDLIIVGTGDEVPPGCDYLGTWQDGGFVWHLYLIK